MTRRRADLEARREQLLAKSNALRAELAADQRIIADALTGLDRALGVARRVAPPLLLVGGALLVLKRVGRRRARIARAAGFGGLLRSGLNWIKRGRRLLTALAVIRAVRQVRRRAAATPETQGSVLSSRARSERGAAW